MGPGGQAVGYLGLAQGLAATALSILEPSWGKGLVPLLWIGAGGFLITFLIVLYRSGPPEGNAGTTASVEGSDNTQAVAGRDALAQSGSGPNLAQQGHGHTLNYYEAEKQKTNDGRIIVEVLPQELCAFYEEHTTVQAQKLISPYIGKWMRVEGSLYDVEVWREKSENRPAVWHASLAPGVYGDTSIMLWFSDAEQISRLEVVRKGANVKTFGRIRSVYASSVVLEDCELLDD